MQYKNIEISRKKEYMSYINMHILCRLVELNFTKDNISTRYTMEYIIYPRRQIQAFTVVIHPFIPEKRCQKFRHGLNMMVK